VTLSQSLGFRRVIAISSGIKQQIDPAAIARNSVTSKLVWSATEEKLIQVLP
jgi:hypothetical protein